MIEKYKRLVQKLQEATDNRKLAWEKTSRENEYQAVVGDNSVSIKYHERNELDLFDKTSYVSLFLWNNVGVNIDEIKADTLNIDFSALHTLYESARRASMKVEETIDELLSQLE